MTALRKSSLSDDFRNELARLTRAGLPLLPLGGGAEGKAPLLKAWAGPTLPLGHVLAPLHRTDSQVYGVRLDDLSVIDCDDDSLELVAAMEARFGVSPVHVKTPRGRHLYYRATKHAPNLRGEGLPVDIKTGPRSYVVGPMSRRPDGGLYLPDKGSLGMHALTQLRAPQGSQKEPLGQAALRSGERHVTLVKKARQMVEYVDSAEELEANLRAIRDDFCEDVQSMPDTELRGIAVWTWKLRLENKIYKGRESAFPLNRLALDALRSCDNETDAVALYVLLQDMHAHTPGKRFALDFKTMRNAGLTRMSIPRLRAARRSMQAVGLLVQVGKHRAGSVHQTFCLARERPTGSDTTNIIRLGAGGEG